nr:hypothetical protein HK105_007667 [Polyrhizophydium stewartii]
MTAAAGKPDEGELPKLKGGKTSLTAKEIPIAARAKGARIGAPTIGPDGKSKGARAPAYSFGIKLKTDRDEQTPGPNKFFPQTTRTGLSKGPAFSLQGGFKKKGPGKYNPTYIPSKEPKAPAYSIQPRRQPEKDEINSTLGMHPIVTVPAAAAYSIRSQRPLKPYSPVTNSKIKHAAPAYSLGARLVKPEPAKLPKVKKEGEEEGEEGGAEDDSPSLKFVRQNIPQFSFRCKHSEYELFIPDCLEGEFSF